MPSGSNPIRKLLAGTATAAALLAMSPAHAVPALQLYLEGSVYDSDTETWVGQAANGVARLWVIGTPGNKGDITDVKLVTAYGSANGANNVGITVGSSTTDGLGGFTDPSTPSVATGLGEDTTETSPLMNSGAELERPNLTLPPHGIYGSGTYFQEFSLGDFALTDSPTGDFIDGFPVPGISDDAQINVYEITVAGLTSGSIHFDVYGTQNGKDVFAPFSHDAEAHGSLSDNPDETIPEPGQLVLLGLGVFGLCAIRRRRRNV